MRKWSTSEDRYLREYFGKLTVPELARRLGRTKESVKQRAYKLGLVSWRSTEQLAEVCRDCYYRRGIGFPIAEVRRESYTRRNSCCHYSLWTGIPCEKHPTDDYCEFFKKIKG